MTSGHGNGYDGTTSSDLLTVVSNQQHARRTVEIREWQAIVAWAENNLHTGPDERHVDDVVAVLDTGIQLAGEGTPKVSEFALMELTAVLERSPESGRFHVARILECAWRLHQVYEAVIERQLPPHKAARIAEHTLHLSPEAAAFVDGQLFAAHRITWAQLDRLVDEAVKRFDPETAEAERKNRDAHLRVQMSEPTPEGLVYVDALLDAADAKDANSAISRRAELRAKLGDTGTLDQRRARGLGDLARADLELDLLVEDADGREIRMPACKAEVVVHVTPETFTGENPVGRWEQRPVSAEQIKEWLRTCSTVVVRPVIDLADCAHVDAYEIPDRLRRQVEYRDHLQVPRLHPRRHQVRPRPPTAPRRRRPHLRLQPHPTLPQASPGQDPQPVEIPMRPTRGLRMDQPHRPTLPRHPQRHPTHRLPTTPATTAVGRGGRPLPSRDHRNPCRKAPSPIPPGLATALARLLDHREIP